MTTLEPKTPTHVWRTITNPALWCFLMATLPGVAELTAADTSNSPRRLKRSESFLGIHFDFHAGPDCTEVGKNTTPEMVAAILDKVKPDYLQIDCKGHPGFSSYPTKVGNPAPGFVGDPLRVWRKVTAERGVALYMHYSGVWDSRAIQLHPDWAVINADGKTNPNATSVFGPYVDRLLIPQLRELAGEYHVDGAWVDGECWATVPDYGEASVKAFTAATGFTDVPRRRSDPHWFEWMEFQREAFRKYLRHYLAEVKRTNPDFEIASNWAFSEHMPEPVSAPVAFLSGDFSPENSVNSARFSARCFANQGKPWDLMAWSFANAKNVPRHFKSAVQLQREAALVLAQGGGFQAYFSQGRDGSVELTKMDVMAEVAKFCRERQKLCHRAVVVPQIALLYSRASHYRQSPQLFTPNSPTVRSLRGVLQGLVESRHCLQIISEHHLHGHMSDWPLIVLPECEYLDADFRDELVAYVKRGGRLLVVGPKAAAQFVKELDVVPDDPEPVKTSIRLEHGANKADLATLWQGVKLGRGVRTFGAFRSTDETNSPARPAATITRLGQGSIAAVWLNVGERCADGKTPAARDFLDAIAGELFPKPMVEVSGSHNVDVSLARNHGKLQVHLVNTSGPHATQPFVDEIAPVGPLQVTLRAGSRPKRITVEPGGRSLEFKHANGETRFTVAEVPIHNVVVVE
ncbi:MAG: hypothetical protein HY298_27250 [Verrucomicrobia bacterium]|nr:hypothetical protein [Verrucomicrobiota bacterium]